MKIQVASDIHTEFHADYGKAFLNDLQTDADVLVVAGDLTTRAVLQANLTRICQLYPNVVYVLGNHEFYGSSRHEVFETLAEITSKLPNLYFLHNSAVEIEGVKFAGTPLWYSASVPDPTMNDFNMIRDICSWSFKEHKDDRDFLASLESADVVITHLLPCSRSIHPKYAGSSLNRYFFVDVEDEIIRLNPSLWIHGHTHESCDYSFGRGTRIVCNPFGYAGYEENPNFSFNKIVEYDVV